MEEARRVEDERGEERTDEKRRGQKRREQKSDQEEQLPCLPPDGESQSIFPFQALSAGMRNEAAHIQSFVSYHFGWKLNNDFYLLKCNIQLLSDSSHDYFMMELMNALKLFTRSDS